MTHYAGVGYVSHPCMILRTGCDKAKYDNIVQVVLACYTKKENIKHHVYFIEDVRWFTDPKHRKVQYYLLYNDFGGYYEIRIF